VDALQRPPLPGAGQGYYAFTWADLTKGIRVQEVMHVLHKSMLLRKAYFSSQSSRHSKPS
jgi:hypothetical protein